MKKDTVTNYISGFYLMAASALGLSSARCGPEIAVPIALFGASVGISDLASHPERYDRKTLLLENDEPCLLTNMVRGSTIYTAATTTHGTTIYVNHFADQHLDQRIEVDKYGKVRRRNYTYNCLMPPIEDNPFETRKAIWPDYPAANGQHEELSRKSIGYVRTELNNPGLEKELANIQDHDLKKAGIR